MTTSTTTITPATCIAPAKRTRKIVTEGAPAAFIPAIPYLRIVRDLSSPSYAATGEREPVRGPRDVYALLRTEMESEEVERFVVLVLDAQHRLMAKVEVSRGIVNSSLVHPREVFRIAIALGAVSLVLAHNHPSGDTAASADDRAVTSQLVAAGRLLDIPVQDHIIVGRGTFLSFAEAGLL